MKHITTITLASFLLVLSLSFNTIKAQGMLMEVPLKRQIEKSSLVIEGEVVEKKSVWGDAQDNIYTVHTIKVYKVFKGKPVSTLEVVTKGGKVDGMEQVLFPNLKLENNAVGVFTLFENRVMTNKISTLKSSRERYSVYSSLQGFYKYNMQQDAVTNPFKKRKAGAKSFYDEIMHYTKQPFVEVEAFKVTVQSTNTTKAKNNSALLPTGITFSPTTVTAGTQTQITITGSNFGNTQGNVGFRDADSGGINNSGNIPLYIDALDNQILSWSPTQITVVVPYNAGTGDIRVINGDDGTEGVSAETLTIEYALINNTDGIGTQHYSNNGTGNITWTMNTTFDANAEAKARFLSAFEAWRCESQINWVLNSNTTSIATSNINDGVNVITFDTDNDPLAEGILGQTAYGIASCSPRTVRDLVTSIDIVFNNDLDNPFSPGTESWYFGEDPSGIAFSQWDFESVALHELGHAHQLGHVINTNAVMHYAISNFEVQRSLVNQDIEAANIVQGFGTAVSLCGTTQMTNYAGSCSLNIEEQELNKNISIFPNPAQDQLFIKNTSFLTLQMATLYDMTGRRITNYDLSDSSKSKTLNLSNITSGVYFIHIASDKASITRKLVIK